MNKGFVIMAQGADYVKCANILELSIKKVMPEANVTIVTTEMLPYGDQAPESFWKLQNDWQVYECSPYDYTIKLEADMYLPRSIEHWWDILKERDLVVSTHIRNFRQEISTVKAYRRFIEENKLPDTYNAITYFKKSDLADKFFKITRDIWENWEEYKTILKCKVDEPATTDWVYAIACHILGVENTTLPEFKEMSMVHMKQHINGSGTEIWMESLVPELLPHVFRINTFPQRYPVHYHVKRFADFLSEKLNG